MQRHAPIVEKPSAVASVAWPDELATELFAAQLAAHPQIKNAFISLEGPLGAGKTTFVRHLLRALGVQGRIKSPTYAVVEPYTLPDGGMAWHFDFYRFDDAREWEDAGFRDIFASDGLKLAEWPRKAAAVLPSADLHLDIGSDLEGHRRVAMSAHTPLGLALLEGAHTFGAHPPHGGTH